MSALEMLVALGVAGLMPLAAVLAVRRRSHRTWQEELVAYVLRFPRELDPSAVIAFLSGLSGMVAPRLERPFVTRALTFETIATSAGISHHLVMPRRLEHVALAALRAALPGVGAQPDPDYHLPNFGLAAELGLSDHARPLANQPGVISSAVLASLYPLEPSEQVLLQWTLSPLGPVDVAPRVSAQPMLLQVWELLTGHRSAPTRLDPELVQAARIKQRPPLFSATARVGVVAETIRTRSLMLRVLAAFHTANAPGVHLYRLRRSSRRVAQAASERWLPLVTWPCTLNAVELAGLLAFPLGKVSLPGLRLGGARQLTPAAEIASRGRIVAQASFPGAERPLALSVKDSLSHVHVIGPTGSGKSTLLTNLITQDMAAGRGVVVLDPKGDLVTDVLDRVPQHRLADVCALDVADDARPVGLNLLSASESDRELVTEQVVGTLHNLYASSWGTRTDDILRAALLTLVGVPGMTLAEVPLLLTDEGFRRRLVGRLDDPVALGPFWAWYEAMTPDARAQAIGPVMNKLRAFLLRRRLRNVIGQANPKLDMDQALATGKILLVPLSKGVLGEEASALIGSLVVARVWQAVQRRAALPQSERPVTFAFIDEFQDYLKLPMSVADVLAQARGLGLGLTLAHQHLGQLPQTLQQAVLANARSRVVFQTASTDAKTLARELTPYLGPEDLQGLGAYEVVTRLMAQGQVAAPATAQSLQAPPPTGLGTQARDYSRRRYGADRAEVEAAIRARHDGRKPVGALGRVEVRS